MAAASPRIQLQAAEAVRARAREPRRDDVRAAGAADAVSAKVANRRIRLLLGVFVLAFARRRSLRAAWLQGVQAASFGRLASSQHSETSSIPAGRGTIFDRGGVQLAIGEQATTVYADPRQVTRPAARGRDAIARDARLDPTTRLPRARRPHAAASSTSPARPTRQAAALKLRAGPRRGSASTAEERRFYPQGPVASQVLGYAGVDNRGLAGLELALDSTLAGRPGQRDGGQGRLRASAIDVARLAARARRARRLPDARPHDPGERRGGAARHGRAVAREERDRDRARPAHRRRPGDGDRARLRRERLPERAGASCSATAPSPTPTSPARPSSSSRSPARSPSGSSRRRRRSRCRTRSRSPTA